MLYIRYLLKWNGGGGIVAVQELNQWEGAMGSVCVVWEVCGGVKAGKHEGMVVELCLSGVCAVHEGEH